MEQTEHFTYKNLKVLVLGMLISVKYFNLKTRLHGLGTSKQRTGRWTMAMHHVSQDNSKFAAIFDKPHSFKLLHL